MLTFDLMIVTFTLIIHHRCVSVLIFFFFLELAKMGFYRCEMD